MATNQDQLNLGLPAIPDPPVLTENASRYGNAYLGVSGKESASTNWGDYLRRIPVSLTGLAVAADSHTTSSPGAVLAVQSTAGVLTAVLPILVTGSPASGQCRVTYNADGTATIATNAADVITAIAIQQLQVPAEVIAFLDATTDPA
jgi:hypothetical protein